MIRKIFRRFLAAVLFLSFVGGGVALYRYPPSFLKVKEVVVVSETKHLTEHDLIRLSEIKKGDSLLHLKLSQIRSNLLRYPWIREVRISKRIPNRIFLWVEEEEPVALVEMAQGSKTAETSTLYLVNADGKVFKILEGRDPKDFPIIIGLSEEELKTLLPRLIRFMQILDGSELLAGMGISEMHWARNTGLTLFTKEPCIRLELGEDDGAGSIVWEERMRKFSQMWNAVYTRVGQPKVVDLSIDRKVLVRQRQEIE